MSEPITDGVEIWDPTLRLEDAIPPAPRLRSLDGKVLGLLDNSKEKADIFLHTLAERIGERYHLSPDEGVAVRDVVAMIAERMGKRLDEVSETVSERPGQDAAYVISSRKAREELVWRPAISIASGLDDLVAWIEENWEEIERQPLDYVHIE